MVQTPLTLDCGMSRPRVCCHSSAEAITAALQFSLCRAQETVECSMYRTPSCQREAKHSASTLRSIGECRGSLLRGGVCESVHAMTGETQHAIVNKLVCHLDSGSHA